MQPHTLPGYVGIESDTPSRYVQEVVTVEPPVASAPDVVVHGYTARKDAHLKRLRRIEGQVRGLHRMVEEDQYCIDILTQVAAATKALQAFSLELLDEHLGHCVLHAAEHGG